ncbi:MAG TPA: insulinase family protein, partial [Ktedonobacteraceae bacterium]|nr:insulinase family protein [Ktedonobacteraceae bacterium]
KAAILHEMWGDEEEPDATIQTLIRETSFQDSSLAHDILGTPESIQHTQLSHVRNFWEQQYVANNLIISVAGHFQEEHLLALVDQYAGQWRTGPAQRNATEQKPLLPRRRVKVNAHLQQQFFALALPAVPRHDPDYTAALLGTRVLEMRLYWSILHLGLAEDLEVNLWTDAYDIVHQANILTIEANTLPELVPTVLEKIQRELKHVLEDGVTEAELRRAKNMRQCGRVIASEEMLERAWTLAEQWDFEGRVFSVDEELARIEQVSCEDVMRAFHRFSSFERQVLVSTGPLEDEAFTCHAPPPP